MPDDSAYAPFAIARREDGSRIELGRGAMGITYRATDTQLGRTVALKVINATYLGDPIARQRFLAEARAAAQLHHSNVAGVFQLRAEGEDIFYAMEFVEGETVDAHVRRRGPLPSRLALRIILQAAQGLAAADARGLIHRDIKPANLMLARAPATEGEGIEHEEDDGLLVKVIDFGLAKNVSGNDSGGGLTGGNVVGTPYFMSPEQISNESGSTLDCRSDIYSLGVTLWYLLLSRPPFEGSQFQILSQHLQKRPPLEQLTAAGVPIEIVALIGSMLAKDREERPANHPALIAVLKKILRSGGASTTARPAKESPRVEATDATMAMPATRADEGFWVAVLPFKYTGANAELTALAEGLSEEIVTGLSRFSYLRVIARSATSRYLSESIDVQSAGQELGARYVMEGSLRQAGSKLRVAVQLVDATSGAHLWAETFDRPFNPEAVFELQDDLVPRIVSTVADTRGVLPHTMSEALRSRTPDQLSPYEAVLRSFAYFERINAEEHAIVRTALELAVERAPGHADAWAFLSILYREEYNHGFNLLPDPLGRAFAAARRAIEAAPSNHYAHHALASVLFFRREHQAFRSAAQRAIALNPMDGFTIAYMGFLIAYDGDWERGCALTEQARSLNPHHPGWYWFAPLFDAYRKGEYRPALEIALKINMPGFWRTQLALAAIHGQLGELGPASAATRELLAIRPDFAIAGREELEKWWEPELVMQVIDGLRKAGLDLPEKGAAAPVVAPGLASSTTQRSLAAMRDDEGFWIAVLPFKSSGGAEMESFAEGLGEDLTTGLSRFRYLSIVARASATQPMRQAADERTQGARLGARYALEGSIRQTGSTIRVSAQLVDASTGAQLWAETYDRDPKASGIFVVQDEIANRIVATVADSYGVLVHAMASVLRQKEDFDLPPVAWQFQYFAYREQITPAALAELKSRVERAVERDDRQSDLWACLAQIYADEFAFGFGGDATSLDRALAAGRRAVELDRANQFALVALAQVHFFRQDLAAFRPAAERAMALNPLNTDALGILGLLMVHTGEFQRGSAIVRGAMELNANHAGWMHFAPLWEHFHKGEYERALECANRVDVPGLFWPYLVVASACGHLGRRAEAESAVRDLIALDPEFASHVRSNIERWHFASDLIEPILEGLRRAGLEISPQAGTGAVTVAPATASASPSDSGTVRADEGFWVAVLPFKYVGDNADLAALAALANGLTEDIVTGLSRYSYLRVIARGSTLRYANQANDLRIVGKELGARYVMEGSLRQVGTKVRLAVQLVDAKSGAHLWAENYERSFGPEAAFELQDELVPRIVSTVADMYGVLPQSMSESVRGKAPDQLSPYEAVLFSFAYATRHSLEEHAAARTGLEFAVQKVPGNADAWAMLSMVYADEYGLGFNARPRSLERALEAAQRATDAGPSNHRAYYSLAYVLFLRKEFVASQNAAERALELNPVDGSSSWFMGTCLAYAGDWDRGCALVERAMQLNPSHPGKYRFAAFFNAYRKRDYRGALTLALKINMPGVYFTPLALAVAYGQLGQAEPAGRALRDLLALISNFAGTARVELGKWFDPELVEHILEGLRKAGLEISPQAGTGAVTVAPATASASPSDSGTVRADEGFWVAVLPFKFAGDNADLAALAGGLTEDIVTGLSRFSYLRVVSRSSAADAQSAGKELGARYVMEGSLRQAGTKLRLAVQLVDAKTGAHLWAENYERSFSPGTIFELQDDLVPQIVSTVADQYGVLVHSMSESLRGRSAGEYSAHEAVLRAFGYWERVTREEHGEVREILEAAVARAPGHSDSLAGLSLIYWHEYAFGYNPRPDPLGRARAAAQRAVASAPTNHFAHSALATALYFQKDFQAFRPAAERALSLNRMDASTAAILGTMIAYTGDWEYGLGVVKRAMQLNPHHPGWYHYVVLTDAYRRGDYRRALASALKVNMPGYHWPHALLAAVYGQLGETERAGAALRELHALMPDFGAIAREEFTKWHDAELTEHMLEGLRKAGLEIAPEKGTGAIAIDPAPISTSPSDSGTVRADEGFWVAVLPFKYGGNHADLAALAEGLSEEVVTGLSRFSYLKVIARGSTLRFADQATDWRTVGKELGARYVMEGSLRQAGPKLRLAVQLVDAVSGAHLWAENYERTFSAETVFDLQDDLVPRIVSTVADMHGVLPRSMSEVVRLKAADQMSPYEALLRSFGYNERFTPEDLAEVRTCLERAVQQSPGNAACWAMLSLMYANEYGHWDNAGPDSLDRSLRAARTAVEAAPLHSLPYYALAQALFFKREIPAFRVAAERAVSLNPMDGATAAFMGLLIAYAGDWERGCALSDKGSQLNPNHPGWYRYTAWHDAYRKKDYRKALDVALRLNAPKNYYTHAVLAICYAQLGQMEEARNALRDMLALKPNYAQVARELHGRWIDPDLVEQLMDGLRKAGLEIVDKAGSSVAVKTSDSGVMRADEGFWVAVLPFKYGGNHADLAALAEGLSEEVVTGLSRFSYLKVIARGSTLRYADQATDLRTVGKELGARYVMEGSLRQAGPKLRLAVQLVDAVSGAHLWAENYERTFSAETVFDLQDDLVPRIVSTVADMNGVLPRSMSEAVRSRPPEQLSPYEAVLRSFGYFERVTAEDLAPARAGLELAVRKAPAYADAWAMLALLCVQEYAHGFELQADSLTSGSAAAQCAVEAAPSNHLAYFSLAQALFFQKEFQNFRDAAERAVALNPMDGNSIAFLGELLTYAGDWDRGMALGERAKQLNPNHPRWYWYGDFYNAYRQGDYRSALSFALKTNMPGHWGSQAMMAAAYGQLGEVEAAAKAVRELLKRRPDFAATGRQDIEKWFGPDYVNRLIDGLHKAGLEVPAPEMATSAAPAREAAVAIAVLPFSDLSPAKDQAYLCEGMAEEIMNALVQIEGMRVASRTSAFRARQDNIDLPAIARALSVGHVLEGSVRTSGSRMRVTSQLTDVASGFQLWSERFDREAADIFAVQDEIAAGVVEAVKARLAPGSKTIPTRPQVKNLEAYQHFLEARHYRYTKNDHLTALRAYEKAVALDPSHAPSWVGVAETSMLAAWYSLIPATEAIDRATQALAAAARLHGESAEASYARAGIAFVQRDWPAWDECYRRSLELAPSYVPALGFIGLCQAVRNHLDEALVLFQRARELDPLAPYPFAITGAGLLSTGRVEESISYFDQALALERENSLALWNSGVANIALERYERGIDHLERAASHTRRSGFILGVLGWALATAGRTKEATSILTELRARPAPAPTVVSEVWLLAALGDKEGAFEVLARAEAEFQPFVCLTRLPGFDLLRADPRFAALEKRLALGGGVKS